MLFHTLYQRHGGGGAGVSGMPLGLNINSPYTLNGAIPFANLMLSSEGWELESETSANTTVWTQSHGQVTVSAVTGTAVFRRKLFDSSKISIYNPMPVGTVGSPYTLKNTSASNNIGVGGYGDVSYTGSFSTTTADRTFQYSAATNGFLCLHLSVTATGTYGSGISVWLPGHNGTDVFNSALISFLTGLGSSGGPLRLMDFMSTNLNVDTAWSDRTLTTDPASDPGCTPAWEYAFQLCNRVNRDIWLNIPPQANSAYVSSLAALAFSTLNPSLNVWVEDANERWNYAGPFARSSQWIKYNNHPRYSATVNPTTGVITGPATLTNGEVILPFATRTTVANGINADLANTNLNYYYAHRGIECYVSDVSGNTFRLKDGPTGSYITFPAVRGNASYATNSVTDITYVRVSDAGTVDIDGNYAAKSVANWSAFDTAFGGATRVKAIMGTQVGTPGRSTARLAVTGASRYNYLAGAPYFKGPMWIGAVDVASGQFTFKFWTAEGGTSTFYGGVYANGSNPLDYEVMNGAGTGFVAGTNKSIAATYPANATYTSATASTGLSNGTTYTACGLVKDSAGNIWRFPNIAITASATTSTVDFPDSYANQNMRHLLAMEDSAYGFPGMQYIDQQKAVIAASSNPAAKYISYECAASNEDEIGVAPAALQTWLRAQTNDAGYRAIQGLHLTKTAAKNAGTLAWFEDVSVVSTDWKIAPTYSDTTYQQYQGYAAFGGFVPVHTEMSPSDITASDINTSPTLPYVVQALANDGTTYAVVSGSPGPDNYDVSGNNLRLVSNTGIDYGTNIARSVKLRKVDGYTDKFFKVSFHTGPVNWFESNAIFALNTTTQSNITTLTPDVGGALTVASGTGATFSGGYLNPATTVYSSATGMSSSIPANTKFLIAFAGNIGAATVNGTAMYQFGGGAFISITHWGTNTVQWRWFGGGTDTSSANVGYDTTNAVHWLYHDGAGNITLGHNQTTDSTLTVPAGAYGNSLSQNVSLGGQSDVVGTGEIVLSVADVTAAKAIVQKIQNLHSIP